MGRVVLNPDVAVMVRDNGRNDGKSQACSGFFGGEIGLEELWLVLLRDARAIVSDLDEDTFLFIV